MSNQNQKVEKTEQVAEQQVQQTAVPEANQPPVVQPTATATEEPKKGIGAFFKKHWKGFVMGCTALTGLGASAVVAYKKGKRAGIMSVPAPQAEPEDYSLNPNE